MTAITIDGPETRRSLRIDLLFLDLTTCTRCLGANRSLEAALERVGEVLRAAGVEVEVFALQGDPADAILDVAEERGSDLIVVGNKGMTGAKRFLLGSVPNKVSHHAPCSVLIIRTV